MARTGKDIPFDKCHIKYKADFDTGGNPVTVQENSYVSAVIETFGCRSDIKINGVSINRNVKGHPLNVNIPISQYTFQNNNNISMVLWPLPGEIELSPSVSASMTVFERPGLAPPDADRVVGRMVFIPPESGHWSRGDEELPFSVFAASPAGASPSWLDANEAAGLEVQHSFAHRFDLPRWLWEGSDPISEDAATRESLLQEYRQLWESLQKRSTARFSGLFAERTRELAQAFSLPEDEINTVRRLQEVAEDPDCELRPLDDDSVLEVFGGGRLARIVRPNGQPLIRFGVRSAGLLRSYNVIFRKSGGQWVLTR